MSDTENLLEINICQGKFFSFLYQNYLILKTKGVGFCTVKIETKLISFSKSQDLLAKLLCLSSDLVMFNKW